MKEELIKAIHNDINTFQYNTSIINDMNDIFHTNSKYKHNMIKIIIKDTSIITTEYHNDSERIIDIINLITKSLDFGKEKGKYVKDTIMYIYVSDVYPFEYQYLPFFCFAKPLDKNGILIPDNTYQCQKLIKKCTNWDDLKKEIKKKCTSSKENIIYFKGANTGADKHNIRKQLSNDYFDIPVKVIINKTFIPLYNLCKYKYLLNLPGHQPWSYRLKYLFLMKSLVINIDVIQHYKNNNNREWRTFYDRLFEPNKDFINIYYNWYEDDDTKNKIEYSKIKEQLINIYNHFQSHQKEYDNIVNNAYKKINKITNESIYDNMFYTIRYYANKFA